MIPVRQSKLRSATLHRVLREMGPSSDTSSVLDPGIYVR
jgi:hypothetical protein